MDLVRTWWIAHKHPGAPVIKLILLYGARRRVLFLRIIVLPSAHKSCLNYIATSPLFQASELL
jgi:hypothetical protein